MDKPDPIAAVRGAQKALKASSWAVTSYDNRSIAAALDAVVAEIERQAQEIAAMRADARAYEYLLHGDYLATKHYLPDLDEAQHKASVRERHASEVGAIDAARAKEAGNGN